jgi:hypothetical protein
MRKNKYHHPLGLGYIPNLEEMGNSEEPTQDEIRIEIERLGLDNESTGYLKAKLARLSLEIKSLEVRLAQSEQGLAESEKARKSNLLDYLRLMNGGSTKSLKKGWLKTAATWTQSKGGKKLKLVNPQTLLRQDILKDARKDVESGLLKHGGKEEWIKSKLKDPKYIGQGLSHQTLIDDIKLKKTK